MRLDARLAEADYHPFPEFWRDTFRRLYEHPTATAAVNSVGRGGGKSFGGVKFSLNEVLFGGWKIPAGERHFWAFVSTTKDEADQRLRLIESMLRALGVEFDTDGDEIKLRDLPLGWRVFAGTIAAASGFRCVGYVVDEAAKLKIAGKNPLEEIVISLNAMCVTHATNRAKRILISSPVGRESYFYKRWEAGDNEQQITSHAATWEANPSISYEATLLAEPDPRYHSREYAAIATDSIGDESFFGDLINVCVDVGRKGPEPYIPGRMWHVAIDHASKARGDRWGYAVVTSEPGPLDEATQERAQRRLTVVHEADSWVPDEQTPSNLLRRLKREVLSRYDHHTRIAADQDSFTSLRELGRSVGLTLFEVPWVGGASKLSKLERYRLVRTAMQEGALRLPDHAGLLSELREIKTALTETGAETIRTPRTPHRGHCDAATACVLACSNGILMTPHLPPARMSVWESVQRTRNMRNTAGMIGAYGPTTDADRQLIEHERVMAEFKAYVDENKPPDPLAFMKKKYR